MEVRRPKSIIIGHSRSKVMTMTCPRMKLRIILDKVLEKLGRIMKINQQHSSPFNALTSIVTYREKKA